MRPRTLVRVVKRQRRPALEGIAAHRAWLRLWLLLARIVVCASSVASAGPRAASHDDLLNRAAQLLHDKKPGDAQAVLTTAYRGRQDPAVLNLLALLAEAEGRKVAAEDLFRRYLAAPEVQSAADAKTVQSREHAQQVLSAPNLLSGQVSLFGPRGALVFLDDRLVGSLPLPLPLLCDPGSHRIAIEQGKKRLQGKVAIRAGHQAEMRLDADSGAVLVTLLPAVLLIQDDLPADELPRVERSVQQALQASNYIVLRAEVALAQAQQLPACLNDAACLATLAEKNGVSYSLRVQSKALEKPGARRLSVAFLDRKIGLVGALSEQTCDPCSADSSSALLGPMAKTALITGISRPRGTLVVKSTPPGAEIFEGEQRLGVTPYQRAAYAEAHTLTLRRDGYQAETLQVTVSPGQVATADAALRDLPEPDPAPLLPVKEPPRLKEILVPRTRVVRDPRPRLRIGLGIAAMALGVGVGGLGIKALTLDGSCVDPPTSSGGTCREIFQTKPAGVALLVLGGVLLGGGALTVALPGRTRTITEYDKRLVPAESTDTETAPAGSIAAQGLSTPQVVP